MSKYNDDSVVFFGSGPVAAKSLRLLLNHREVEAVITKPTTLKMMSAIAKNIPVYTVSSKVELENLLDERGFISPLGVLIDFGIIVSKNVIESFEYGIINSHFSLLPEWRGADPISFSILSGQKKTGVSLMLIDEGMDTGKILVQKSLPIEVNETTPALTNRLIALSDSLLSEYIPRYIVRDITPRNQPHPDRATYSRKLTKDDGILDFTKPAVELEREIRAFIEWPKSRTEIAGKDVVITKAHTVPSIGIDDKPGDITAVNEAGLIMIATTTGSLCIEELKPAGKRAMSAKAFLAGYGNRI